MEKGKPTRHTSLTLATLAKCPRRYEIEYVNNYRLNNRRPAPWPPSLKQLLRDALRERDIAQVRGYTPLRARAIAEAIVNVYAEEMLSLVGNVSPQERERHEEEIREIGEEARRIILHYDDAHRDSKALTLLAVDQVVEKNPLGGADLTYAERIDGLVDLGGRKTALVRHFTANADREDVQAELVMSLALRGQLWAASAYSGETISSALVDVVRTKAPSEPETIQCKKCRGDGKVKLKGEDGTAGEELIGCDACSGTGVGGLSKRPCDTTLKTWKDAVARHGLDIAAETTRCSEIVSRLERRGENFAYRLVIDLDKTAIKDWAKDVVALASLVGFYSSAGYWPKNPAACVGRSGPCPYRKACNHHGDVDVAWFTKTDEPYPGLA